MKKPETCPDEIYELMLDCWQVNYRLRPTFDKIVERIIAIIKDKEQEISIYSNLSVNYANYPIELYYSNNSKKIEQLEKAASKVSISTLPYYNSSLSIASPTASNYHTIGSANDMLRNNQTTKSYQMSTFKSQPVSKVIEMPGKQQVTLSSLNNESIYNNEEAVKLYSPTALKEDETSLCSRKNSNNSGSNLSALSMKLNRQNAIDLNEADNKTYEYVMRTPHILVDKAKISEDLNEDDLNDVSDGDKNVDKNNYAHPIRYFK